MNRKLWNGIRVTELRSPGGAAALVAEHGAHVVSWIPAGGEEMLFVSERSHFDEEHAIRGGVPIIFPQFNRRGNGMRHGFARLAQWRPMSPVEGEGSAVVRYKLTQADTARFKWDQPFTAVYEVALGDKELSLSLTIGNPSEQSWQFTAALHTYLRVSTIGAVRLSGLQGASYTNFAQGGATGVQQQEFLEGVENVDYIFADVREPIGVYDKERLVFSSQRGFRDAVVWNPGAELAATISDLAPESHRFFLCVEAAAVEQPVVLRPHQGWTGVQRLTVGGKP
jgi:glucose-6-phosphate 1-epimerase